MPVSLKALRSNQTDAELRLWYHLRAHRFMGLKFRRQKPMGPYVVDFVCIECRLIVEVDGGQHAGSASDARRDAWLQARGFSVLRFWNNEVMQELEEVLERIRLFVEEARAAGPLPQVFPCLSHKWARGS